VRRRRNAVPRAAPNTGTTSGAIGTAEPSRYARILLRYLAQACDSRCVGR